MKSASSYFAFTFLIFLIFSLWLGCAQQSSPVGGAQDVVPPKIVESEPLNFSKNYQGNKIELKFDEFVQINTLEEQLIVTPSLLKKPELKIKGKKLTIHLQDSLAANTTYLFNFGEGIKDITENNPLDSNLFVFSTGNIIDSLFIEGQVKDAFTLVPQPKILVALYTTTGDSVPFKDLPVYFTRTDNLGKFKLNFLKEGAYKLVAFDDVNLNYLFDPATERVAFCDSLINPKGAANYDLKLFQELHPNQYVVKAVSPEYGKVLFIFNEPTQEPAAKLLEKSFKKAWYIKELGINRDTMTYWVTESVDTMAFEISDNNKILDTAEVIMAEKPKPKKWEEKKLGVSFNPASSGEIDLFNPLKIITEHPVKGYESIVVTLIENDKDTMVAGLQSTDEALRRYEVKHNWKEDSEYQLTLPAGWFVDIFGLMNDTLKMTFKTATWNKYANVNVQLETKETGQFLLQLFSAKDVLIKEDTVASSTAMQYEHLLPGSYKLKLIYDSNANGKWDTGKLIDKIQPEKIIYYSGKIDVRSGWDVDIKWTVEDQ